MVASVDISIMIYDQSWRGPLVNAVISDDTMSRLVELPNVAAMEHNGMGDLIEEYTILDRFHDRVAYIDSSAGYAATTAHMHSATRFISGVAPWWPEFEL